MAKRTTRVSLVSGILLIAIALAGTIAMAAKPVSVPPMTYLNPVVSFQMLFAPLEPGVRILQGVWSFLPHLVLPVVVVAVTLLAIVLYRTESRILRYLAGVVFVGAALVAGGWGVLLSGGTLPTGGFTALFLGAGRLIAFPVAIGYFWLFRLMGGVTYVLPVYLAALAVSLLLTQKRTRNRIVLWSSAMLATALLGSLAVSFIGGQGGAPDAPILEQYLSRFLPRAVGATVFTVLFLVCLGLILSNLTGVSFASMARSLGKGRKRKVRPDKNGKTNNKTTDVDTGVGGGEAPPSIDLHLTSPDSSQLLDFPYVSHDSAAPSGDAMNDQEAEEARSEADSVFEQLSVPLQYAETILGPSTVLLCYSVPVGVSIKDIRKQEHDIEFRLGEFNAQAIIPIPGKEQVGVILRRKERDTLSLSAGVQPLQDASAALPVYVGRRVDGGDMVVDLANLPHLLVAGTTGSGKSVFLHAIIESLIRGPAKTRTRLVLMDPKRVEFYPYRKGPNLACKIVEEPGEIAAALEGLVEAMEDRYDVLTKNSARNIRDARANGLDMPYVVAILDEMADVFLSDQGERIRKLVIKLAQKSRATGIHLVMATQRPSVDIVDGLIKANFPGRIAFRTSSQVDSRVVLDLAGAEGLYGKGDGLFVSPDVAHPIRFQGAFVEA